MKQLDRLAELQHRYAGRFLLVGLLLAGLAIPLVRTLRIDARMVALLPRDRPAVQDLEAAEARMRSSKSLTVAIESPSGNTEALRRAVDALAERLSAHPTESLGAVDASVRSYQAFAEEYAHLFVPLTDLEALRDAIEADAREARLDANPFYLDFEDEDEDAESLDEVIERLQARADQQAARYPEGYYQHQDGTLIALFVRTGLSSPDVSDGEILQTVRDDVAAMDFSEFGDDLEVTLAGDVIIQREEQAAITQELGIALLITLSGVLLLVLAYFRRFRALPLLAFGLGPGTVLSFALASLTVGQLNLTTAFLGSVLLGNGINPSIIWLARYFEERRQGIETADALKRTHRAVFVATLVAASAAAAAYGSLVITDFRGFRDFGVIGGAGMVLSWVSAISLLPAATVLAERIRPLRIEGTKAPSITEPFARLVQRAPGAVLVLSVVLVVVSFGLVAQAVADDPFEYNFRQLRSERPEGSSPARVVNGRVNEILSSSMQGRGIAMLAESREDLAYLKAELDRRRGDGSDYDGYKSLTNLLPSEMDAKVPVLEEIRRQLLELRPRVDAEKQARIDEYLPPETITLPTIDDIPDDAARLFIERDGRRGLVLVVEEAEEGSIWDGRYLLRWTEALREVELEDGSRPLLVGQAPVFADMIGAVYADMPRAIGAALLVTILLAWFGFRRFRAKVLALCALLIGVLWMAASMALAGMKLHFLNFIAFPITFGNGVDYPVNVLQRFEADADAGDEEAMVSAVSRSGGAVLLCSLTTIIGYSSLYASANLAMNSFGLAMAISEVTCCVAALITIPSWVVWRARKKAANVGGDAA